MIIYKITCLKNNKVYIGQTTRALKLRFRQHINDSKKFDYTIYRAIRKYGEKEFIAEQIDRANSIEELNKKEIYWIDYYNSTDPKLGYNTEFGGKNSQMNENTKNCISKKAFERKNKTGYYGVMYCKKRKTYYSEININGKITYICSNNDPKICAETFDSVAKYYNKNHALNFPENKNIKPISVNEIRKNLKTWNKNKCLSKYNGITYQYGKYSVSLNFEGSCYRIGCLHDETEAAKIWDYYTQHFLNKKENLNFKDGILSKCDVIKILSKHYRTPSKNGSNKGVKFNKGYYSAFISNKYIGSFKSEDEAVHYRDNYIIKNEFDWRSMNFPERYVDQIDEFDFINKKRYSKCTQN